MRAALKSALALLLISIARPAAAQRLDVAALPGGELPPIPAARPSAVPQNDAIDSEGLWVATSPHRPSEQWGSLAIWDNPEAAKLYARGDYSSLNQVSKSCFRVEDAPVDSPGRWPLTGLLSAQMDLRYAEDKSAPKDHGYSPVRAIRLEHLTFTGKSAKLYAIDLWIDVRSRAMRLIERREIDLVRVAGLEPAATVFAARGTDAVHFVIVPTDEKWKAVSQRRLGSAQIALERGAEQGVTACGHALLSLRAPPGTGETATVRLKTATRWLPQPTPPGRSIAAVVTRVLAPGQADPAADFSGEVTVRGLAVHVSASRPRLDRPLSASVAFNWTREVEELAF